MRQALRALVLAAAIILGLVTSSALPAHASVTSDMVSLVNSSRSGAGLGSLSSSAGLASVAQSWAQQLAASGQLSHNPSTQSQIPSGWTGWAENVAFHTDPSAQRLHELLMGSAGHRANIMGGHTHIGVGYATTANGTGYVVEVFASYPGAVTDPEPDPTTPPPPPGPTPTPDEPTTPSSSGTGDGEDPADGTPSPGEPTPVSIPDGWLGPGADHTQVRHLQQHLADLGYTVIVDGIYGPRTTEAVRLFQSAHGLVADGLAGPLTLAAVASALDAADDEDGQDSVDPGDGAQAEPDETSDDETDTGGGPTDPGTGSSGPAEAGETRPVGQDIDPVSLVATYALVGVVLLTVAAAAAITLGATRPRRPDYRRMLVERANEAILKLR